MKKTFFFLMSFVVALCATATNQTDVAIAKTAFAGEKANVTRMAPASNINLTFGTNTPSFQYYTTLGNDGWYFGCRENSDTYVVRLYYVVGQDGQFGTYDASYLDLGYSFISDYSTGSRVDIGYVSEGLSFTFAEIEDGYTFTATLPCVDGNTYYCYGEWSTAQNNMITYTAVNKQIETQIAGIGGIHTNAFNTSITSHTFSNGKGTITFAGDVTSIGDNAFYFAGITGIKIPSSVTTIGKEAFCGSALRNVKIPNAVTSIGDGAFSSCNSLVSVTIGNSVTSIGRAAFNGCSSLSDVTIGNSVTNIGFDAFGSCSSLPVENNVRYADTYLVMAVVDTLSTYIIKEGTKWIGFKAFDYCQNLTSITIPNSVTNIEFKAFCSCNSLTSITIPDSVTSIGEEAFEYCFNLNSITCLAVTPPTCGVSCFNGVSKSIPVYVPTGSVSAYQTADQWSEFYDIQSIGTALDTPTDSSDMACKILRDGQVLILRAGHTYDLRGQEVK